MRKIFIILSIISFATMLNAKEKVIKLEKPNLSNSPSYKKAIENRKTSREFSPKEFSTQEISNILWAANGFNRPEKRTAPTARDTQNIDLYILIKYGIYLYNAQKNELILIQNGDFKKIAGLQEFTWDAPLTIFMVANYGKNAEMPKNIDRDYSFVNTGYISQNIYLYSSANDLATVARGMIDKEELTKRLKLNKNQEVLLAQSIGYKK